MSDHNTPEGLRPGEEFWHAENPFDFEGVPPLGSILRDRGRPEALANKDVFGLFAGDHHQQSPLMRTIRVAGVVLRRVFRG